MPIEPGMMLLSVSEVVPLVWMLFPLQPGYVITVWAVASEQLAAATTNSVNRTMMAESVSEIEMRYRSVLLFCENSDPRSVGVHNRMVVNANRTACGGGGIST
jgi:hypothetical protein